MIDDLTLVRYDTPKTHKEIEIIPIGDIHAESPRFDSMRWRKLKNYIARDNVYVVIVGDTIDMALKSSKTSVYESTMSPHTAKKWVKDELYDFKDKIIAVIPGNHEARGTKEAGLYPLYDICELLGIENRYRNGMALIDLAVGTRKDAKQKQVHYTGCIMHKTRKTKQFSYADTIDGLDFYISGHTHKPSDEPMAKVVIDPHNKKASIKPYEDITVSSMLNYGGYAVSSAYRVQSQKVFSLILNGETKQMQTRGFYL